MIALFNQTALECSKLITEKYSTSFTLGIDGQVEFAIQGFNAERKRGTILLGNQFAAFQCRLVK